MSTHDTATDEDQDPTYLNSGWAKQNMGVNGAQSRALRDAFGTRERLLEALRSGEDLTKYEGIGEKTAGAMWEWFRNDFGETVEPDDELVLDDDGLHLPDWIVGYVGRFTLETPSITMQATTTDEGLSEVSEVLGAYPEEGCWNERLPEGMIALSTPGHRERIYKIDDQRTEDDA